MDPPETEPLSGESPEAMRNEHLIQATKSLRRHLGLAETPGEKSSTRPPSSEPLFWVEVAPPSARGAGCRLGCPKNIMPGEYRIAVNPGQHWYYGNKSSGTAPHINSPYCASLFCLFIGWQISITSTALRRSRISLRRTF
jgi:hypothetical protein